MKKIALIAALGLMGMGSAMAQTVNGGFDVTVTLTSKCELTTVGTPALAFGTYESFAASASTATPVTLAFRCTRGLVTAPTVAFDTGAGTSSTTAATATGEGVISGLRYTMAVGAATVVAGNAPVVATLGDIGTASTRTYQITGNMPAGQAGTASSGIQTQARTLIVTY